MTKALIYACAMVVAASLAGCRSTGEVEYAGEVRVTSPELIAIGPGVQVVADADEPLFFADGMYWLYRDGYWFRANDYRRDFVRVDFSVVPEPLRGLQQPETYAHYRTQRGRTREARPSPARTRSQQPLQPTQPPHQHDPTQPPQQPSETPTPQPPAPTPEPTLPSQTTDPTAPPPPYTPDSPPPGEAPARPTSPPGNAAPVQPGPTPPPVDEPDRETPPPATSTDDRTDASDETKRLDEKKDPDTTDE